MRLGLGCPELLNGQVVGPDKLDPTIDCPSRPIGRKVREVLTKTALAWPEVGVVRLEQQSLDSWNLGRVKVLRLYPAFSWEVCYPGWPNERIQRQRIDCRTTLDEVERRIDVGSCVRSKRVARDVASRASPDSSYWLDLDWRIARPPG